MGGTPNTGNLAGVLVLKPSARINVDAPSSETSSQIFSDADTVKIQAHLARKMRAWDQETTQDPASAPEWVEPGETLKPDTIDESALTSRKMVWRLIKTVVALAAVMALGWKPLQRAVETMSAEAVVNARLVTVRAPIDGTVTVPARRDAEHRTEDGIKKTVLINIQEIHVG